MGGPIGGGAVICHDNGLPCDGTAIAGSFLKRWYLRLSHHIGWVDYIGAIKKGPMEARFIASPGYGSLRVQEK